MHESIIVGTGDFRQALGSVRVHASDDKESPAVHRVRLQFGRQHLTISATDRYTAAMAIVSLWGDRPPGGYRVIGVELLPDDAAKILSIFKGGKEPIGSGISPENLLRLEVLDEHLRITDCSGMIDGRALQLPRLSTEDSALAAIAQRIEEAHQSPHRTIDDMAVSGDTIARFREASRAYGAPLLIEGRGTRSPVLLVRCGESFLGVMASRELTADKRERVDEFVEGWANRLPGIVFEARTIDAAQNGAEA
ncbi:hypothetical protein [Nocardia brasiliensis]|uniref:hypothetical protein n=1 Tax=Nocardia brasiliensis TaxID=37326 RepID=UPI0036711306